MKTKTTHTPGPWIAGEAPNPRDRGIVGYQVATMTEIGHTVIAEIHTAPYPVAVNPANARLIAAAPDLLEACREALKLIANLREDCPVFGFGEDEVEQVIRAAIAKAQGEG